MQDRNTTLKLEAQELKVMETCPVAPCEAPSRMDIDRAHQRIFIGCRGGGAMAVLDVTTGKVVTTQPIGRGVDAAEFAPATGLIYFSTGCGDGALSVFREDSPDKYTLVENVKTQPGARTMALDHKTGRVYLAVADFGPRPYAETGKPQPRAPILPGTFSVLVIGQKRTAGQFLEAIIAQSKPCSITTFSRTMSRCAAISRSFGSTRFTCSSASTNVTTTGRSPPASTR
jgi:hypothetical protein